jgi:hypothetical protein
MIWREKFFAKSKSCIILSFTNFYINIQLNSLTIRDENVQEETILAESRIRHIRR